MVIMRIDNSYISEQPKLTATNSASFSANQAPSQQKIKQAKDSYTQNATSAQVIDAEYVDLYNQETRVFKQENQSQHLTLETDATSPQQKFESGQDMNSVLSRYQMAPIDTPPPGTYLNIFA